MTKQVKSTGSPALKRQDVPSDRASWNVIQQFALGLNGYEWAGNDKCGQLANSTRKRYEAPPKGQMPKLSLDELRACLFFEQRRFHHFGWNPSGADLTYIRALIKAIRDCLPASAPARKTK
jgi:hypothetical protein